MPTFFMAFKTLLGSIGGGILRIVLEILNWMDQYSAGKHELKMQDAAYKSVELRGSQRMQKIGTQNQIALDNGLDALVAGI